jgi:hypothetical protein
LSEGLPVVPLPLSFVLAAVLLRDRSFAIYIMAHVWNRCVVQGVDKGHAVMLFCDNNGWGEHVTAMTVII